MLSNHEIEVETSSRKIHIMRSPMIEISPVAIFGSVLIIAFVGVLLLDATSR